MFRYIYGILLQPIIIVHDSCKCLICVIIMIPACAIGIINSPCMYSFVAKCMIAWFVDYNDTCATITSVQAGAVLMPLAMFLLSLKSTVA